MYIIAIAVDIEEIQEVLAHLRTIDKRVTRSMDIVESTGNMLRWFLIQPGNPAEDNRPVHIRLDAGFLLNISMELGQDFNPRWQSLTDTFEFVAYPNRQSGWCYSIGSNDHGLTEMILNTLRSTHVLRG